MAGQGTTSKAAFKIETGAYGTSIAVGSGNQIPFISESVNPAFKQEQSNALEGNAGAKTLYPILKQYAGDLLLEGHYSGMLSLLISTLGMSHQTSSPINIAGSAYMHYIEPSEDLSTRTFDGYEMATPSGNAIRRGTLCFEKDTSVWEHTSAMFNSMTMEASPERVTFSFTIASYALDFDTVTNPNSASWALIASDPQILFEDMDVYIKARDLFTIAAANDNVIINEGGGNITLDIADGTYTAYELAQKIAAAANAHTSLSGAYSCEYDEEQRRFKIWTTGQTFSVIGSTMDMGATIGITTNTTTAQIAQSNFDAQPNGFVAFADADKIGVSKISLSVQNNLDIESQDSTTALNIAEPERNGRRVITGQIEIPRYKNDTFLNALNGGTTYGLQIKFTSAATITGGQNYQLNFHLPAVKFNTAGVPVTGAELLKQTISFTAQSAFNFPDWVNFAFGAYTMRSLSAAAASVQCFGSFVNGLYAGASTGEIMKWNGSSWSTSCDVGTDSVICIQQYKSKLYEGGSSGIIRVMDATGLSWSTSCDVGTGDVTDMELYGDNLYACESSTGKILSFNDTSWALSCDTLATQMKRLIAYNNSLYAVGLATTVKVYAYNGTTWSTSCDLGAGTEYSAAVHRGKLYVSVDSNIFTFDGSAWVNLGVVLGFDVKQMISYRGHLILFSTGTGDIYIFDLASGSEQNIYSSLNIAIGYKPILYQGILFMPVGTTQPKIFKPIDDILIQNQNTVVTNPL